MSLRSAVQALVTEYRSTTTPAPYTSESALIERLEGVLEQHPVPVEETRQDECTEENKGRECKAFCCYERQPSGRVNLWWADYGTCTEAHAVDYYGEEAIER